MNDVLKCFRCESTVTLQTPEDLALDEKYDFEKSYYKDNELKFKDKGMDSKL